MFQKKREFCPVGEHAEIGYRTKGERTTLICKECMFAFTWEKNGKLLPPVKLANFKSQICECPSCQDRDDRARTKPKQERSIQHLDNDQ